jgi:BlaI family penicillinase repressor
VEAMPTPTPAELDILKVLWEHGPLSVRDVHRLLPRSEELAYNTVQTLLRIMEEKKGLVEHQVEGRTFIYSPRFTRAESASRYLGHVFDGAVSELVLSLLRSERISAKELADMEAMIAEARRKRPRNENRRGA